MHHFKGALILLTFLIVLGFIIFNPLSHDFDESGGTLDSLYLIFPASLFLTGVFLFSLHQTEKKISQGIFSYRLILKIGIYIALLIAVLVFLLMILLPGGGHPPAGAFAPIVAPLASLLSALFFSTIPSFLLNIFYGRQNLFRIISLSLLFLSLLLSIFYIASVATCEFNTSAACLALKAIREKDPTVCEKAKWDSVVRDICYRRFSNTWTDPEICRRISGKSDQFDCYVNVAKNTNNSSICDNVQPTQKPYFRIVNKELCYKLIAD